MRDIDVTLASTELLLSTVMTIRGEVYHEEKGWLNGAEVCDEYDAHSEHFLAFIGQNPIASARMITREPCEMEKTFDLSQWRSQGKCVEVGRLAVLPEYRRSLAAVALFRALYKYAVARDIRFFCIAHHPSMSRFYSTLGFLPFGEVGTYMPISQPTVAEVLDLPYGIEHLRKNSPRIHRYFMEQVCGMS